MRGKDREGKKFGQELERIGYRGAEPVGAHKLGALFELHIEQGPILEDEGKMVGVVQGVQGMRWYEVTVTGQDAHTGATPMHLRRNALLGTARMIERVHAIAMRHAPDAVGTVGLVEVKPNSRNVVPGEVFFAVDFRHPDEAELDAMEREFRTALPEVMGPLKLEFEEKRIWNSPAVAFKFGADRMRAAGGGAGGVCDARHGQRGGARRGLSGAGGADDDDLRAVPGRDQPQ